MPKIYEALEFASKERFGRKELKIGLASKDEVYTPPNNKLTIVLSGLNQSIVRLLPDRRCRIVQFISAYRGEGTSILIRELARFCALKMRKQTLLLDADNQHSGHLNWFNLKADNDWCKAIAEGTSVKETLHRVRNTPLYLAKAASKDTLIGINPTEPGVDAFMDELKEDFELVLIDTYPATMLSDNLLLFNKVDAVILVVQAERVRYQMVKKVQERIEGQGGNLLGVILNKINYHIPG